MRTAASFAYLCCALAWHSVALSAGEPAAELSVPNTLLDGENPGIRVSGLRPGEIVRLHALRSLEKWKQENGNWVRVRQALHAYADFAAGADGNVAVDSHAPIKGTYAQPDPLALLRTGYRYGDPGLSGIRAFPSEPLDAGPENRVWVKLERDGQVVAERTFDLIAMQPGSVTITQKFGDGWHAVYARPAERNNLPVVISLHGSEGGSVEKAQQRAIQLAARGFAAVGANYFAYQHEAIEGVPTRHAEIKLEILESMRAWLKTRPEVDTKRISLLGGSKGAEFALLAASKYDWIDSVVAVVPSDIVWEGYDGGGEGAAASSWSFRGAALPFVPTFPFDPKQEGMYRTNTERYERSRVFYSERVGPARIPIEDSKARILLLASDRDEVWASGAMARNIVERLVLAGKSNLVEVKIYPQAGHQIWGTGTFPVRLYGEQSSDPNAKDLLAEGAACADAWRRTLQFLTR